jgi:hypothetical protein
MFAGTAALAANLKAQAFETYVARYAAQWGKPSAPAPSVADLPKETSPAVAAVAPASPAAPPHDTQGTARPVDKKWTFPSADSIPAVSIMKTEPPLPKGAELPQPKVDPDLAKSLGAAPEEPARLPPKRPQAEATPAAEPR